MSLEEKHHSHLELEFPVTKTKEALGRQVTRWRMGRLKIRTVFMLAAMDSSVTKLPDTPS